MVRVVAVPELDELHPDATSPIAIAAAATRTIQSKLRIGPQLPHTAAVSMAIAESGHDECQLRGGRTRCPSLGRTAGSPRHAHRTADCIVDAF